MAEIPPGGSHKPPIRADRVLSVPGHGPATLRYGPQRDRLPRRRAPHPRVLEGAPNLREDARGAADAAPRLRLLRGPAHRQRPAPQRPRPHARHQGPLPSLQDDARLPRRRARPAGTRTACPSRSRSRRSSASTARPRSRRYGVEPFIAALHRVASSATPNEWERLTERIGFWVDLDDAYVTYHRATSRASGGRSPSCSRRASSTRATRSSGGGRRAAPRSRAAEVGLGYKTVDDPQRLRRVPAASTSPTPRSLVWTTTPWTLAVQHVRRRATRLRLRRRGRRTTRKLDRRRRARARQLAKKLRKDLPVVRDAEGQRRCVGSRYSAAVRHLLQARGSTELRQGRGRIAALARHRRGLRHARQRHRHRPHRARLRRGRLQRPPQARSLQPARGARAVLRREARRHLHPRDGRHRRPLGEGRRQGHHRASSRSAGSLVHAEHVPPRVPVLLARRRRPAHPVRAARLVHPHHRAEGPGASRTTARSTGCPSTSRRAASATSSRTTSTGRSRASATGARRSTSGSCDKRRRAHARAARASREIPAATRTPFDRLPRGEEEGPDAQPSTSSSTSRGSTRSPAQNPGDAGHATAASPRSSTAGSTRAACRSRSGASRTRRARASSSSRASPPTSSARRSIRRAAGSTRC